MKTFEAGSSEPSLSECIYLVAKGTMKLRSGEAEATRGMGIGNIRPFYSSAYEEQDEIEVVKDTWAVEIGIKALHAEFFSRFPHRLTEALMRSPIFC
jgi:hypothetical protein